MDEAELQAYVKSIIDEAPPLTAEQAALLRRILAPGAPPTPDTPTTGSSPSGDRS